MSTDSEEDSLSDKIIDHYEQSKFPVDEEHAFLPDGWLERLVTETSIREELNDPDPALTPPAILDLIAFILDSAKKVFAITLISGLKGDDLCRAMHKFMEHGFVDASLPIMTKDELSELECFKKKPWNKLARGYFYEGQWKFLAYIFREEENKDRIRINLYPKYILPFTFVDEVKRSGTFGDVYQVTIHPAHQNPPMLKVSGNKASTTLDRQHCSRFLLCYLFTKGCPGKWRTCKRCH